MFHNQCGSDPFSLSFDVSFSAECTIHTSCLTSSFGLDDREWVWPKFFEIMRTGEEDQYLLSRSRCVCFYRRFILSLFLFSRFPLKPGQELNAGRNCGLRLATEADRKICLFCSKLISNSVRCHTCVAVFLLLKSKL